MCPREEVIPSIYKEYRIILFALLLKYIIDSHFEYKVISISLVCKALLHLYLIHIR